MVQQFRQEFNPPALPVRIHHQDKIMMIGSCFTENMYEKLVAHKFSVLQNPAGIVFNPVSVANTIVQCIEDTPVTEDALFYLNEAWHNWHFHSRYSHPDKEAAVKKMNASVHELSLIHI